MSTRPSLRPSRPFAALVGGLLLAGAVGLGLAWAGALRGPSLLEVESPAGDETVGLGGVEVLVRFDGAEPATFRALLNGADVTAQLETAANGAHGRLYGLLEGDNRLRLEVFGAPAWGGGWLLEDAREIHIRFRPPLGLDRG